MNEFIEIDCIIDEGEIVPFWDEKVYLKFNSFTEENELKIKGKDNSFKFSKCLYNINTKEFDLGEVIEIKNSLFDVGEDVYVIINFDSATESKIKEIEFKLKNCSQNFGYTVINTKSLNFETINKDKLYNIKYYEPYYILENNMKVTKDLLMKKK